MSKEHKIIKHGYFNDSKIEGVSAESSSVSGHVLERLEKFAKNVKILAPKSDDFLYFSIIFLRAAEASLINENGDLKKVGEDKAWGYFDEKWKWHGNTKPHKNNNGDIFPELELKKASRNWIGMPLCVDHKSDSVDGIRGIILDTHYDERHKQVVGLCALDKINYPNLARKVETGVVRYGSMGTAVSTSICSECGNIATAPSEYCMHVTGRTAWGEINVGLKPIEYSLVVQPAEPEARLLRCIASLNSNQEKLKSFGVDKPTDMIKKLSFVQAEELSGLLKVACGDGSCSIGDKNRMITNFLSENGFVKNAQLSLDEPIDEPISKTDEVAFAKALSQIESATGETPVTAPSLFAGVFKAFNKEMPGDEMSIAGGEVLTSGELAAVSKNMYSKDGGDVSGTGSESVGMLGSDSGEHMNFEDEGDIIGRNMGHNVLANIDSEKTFKNITEEIMNDRELRKRAEARRRLAYYQGGSEGVEPSTFKSEEYKKYWETDKHMHQDGSMGGDTGMFPGDKEKKEQLKRAKEKEARLKREAYHQGGSEGVEPSTFKSEEYKKYWDSDKHMHQDGSMGGDNGMFPGDKEKKEQLKRAKYNGPALKTVFKQVKRLDGTINKEASCFEVYAGDRMIIAATARDIFGPQLSKNWDWITSREYGKAVVAAIRNEGIEKVAVKLTKTAQDMPAPEMEAPMPPEAGGEELPPMPELDEDLSLEGDELEDAEDSPEDRIRGALTAIEQAASDINEALEAGFGAGGDVEINVDVGEGMGEGNEVKLSKTILGDLKVVLAEANESANELALYVEACKNQKKLSKAQRSEIFAMAEDALIDSSEIVGEAKTLVRMAKSVSNNMVKTSQYVEEALADDEETSVNEPVSLADDAEEKDENDVRDETELVAEALNLRKNRRLQIVREARARLLKAAEEADVADKKHKDWSNAEDGECDESAADDKEVEEVAEDAAEEEVEEHEEEMHEDENDAQDGATNNGVQNHGVVSQTVPTARAKLQDSFLKKQAEEEKQNYKIKLRRAYDVAMLMQRKGLLPVSKASLDRQVDLIMDFDGKAFEAFKRSIDNASQNVKVAMASDISELNVGVREPNEEPEPSLRESLHTLWGK